MDGKPIAGRQSRVDFTRAGLEKAGFDGFRSVGELLDPQVRREIPDAPGVYIVIYMGDEPPEFLETSSGGWFKGRDPTFGIEDLETRWVSRARVVYIGMTGEGRRAGLRTRIRAWFDTEPATTSDTPEAGHSGSSRRHSTSSCAGAQPTMARRPPRRSGDS